LAFDAATLPANTDSFCTSTSGSASVCRVSVGAVIAPVGVPRVANSARAAASGATRLPLASSARLAAVEPGATLSISARSEVETRAA